MAYINEPVFIKSSEEQVQAILYQAMFDETIRLRNCKSHREREKIRNFIKEAHQLYFGVNLENKKEDLKESLCQVPQELGEGKGIEIQLRPIQLFRAGR